MSTIATMAAAGLRLNSGESRLLSPFQHHQSTPLLPVVRPTPSPFAGDGRNAKNHRRLKLSALLVAPPLPSILLLPSVG